MEESPWPQKLEALTHILLSPTTTPPLSSQFFIATKIPSYFNSDFPPLLCPKPSIFPFLSLHFQWGFSLFLKRISRFGCLNQTSWRCKCPFQIPPPLILARDVRPAARWSDEERRNYARFRLGRKRLGNDVNPLIPILIPNLFLFSLMFWNPFSSLD